MANGDEELYAERSGTYTKCLLQDAPRVVNQTAFNNFRIALGSGDGTNMGAAADFEVSGLLGGTRRLNGLQGAFAFALAGADSQGFGDPVVPAPHAVASKEYATELVELYWASLFRDVPFTQYDTNPTAIADLNPPPSRAVVLCSGSEKPD